MTSIGTVAVVGIGKLGAPMAACLAAKGYSVLAADADVARAEMLARGEAPVFEPGLTELLQECRFRIQAAPDVAAAARLADFTFIVVPTPSEADGEFSLRYVLAACDEIGKGLRDARAFPIVVLTSTVMPGATGSAVVERLERASGRQCGVDFGLCYSPEFIALGSVIRDLLHPDFVLIGESDPHSGEALAALYRRVCETLPPICRMSFPNAELAKIAVNTFVTTKISYANMLSQICERLPGADVDVVTSALGLDTRIGRKYLTGATAYGGPCFPRDNVAFSQLARRLGSRALLAEATDEINRAQTARLAERVLARIPAGGCVGILGLAYKPGTDVVLESPGMALAAHLSAAGIRTLVYDPAGMENARAALGDSVTYAGSVAECIGPADVLVIATAWDEFRRISPENLARPAQKRAVIDCWRIWKEELYRDAVIYLPLGVGG